MSAVLTGAAQELPVCLRRSIGGEQSLYYQYPFGSEVVLVRAFLDLVMCAKHRQRARFGAGKNESKTVTVRPRTSLS